MNSTANPPPPGVPGIARAGDRLERDYQLRIREFAAAARRVGVGDSERIPELGIRTAGLLAFLRVWRGLIDPGVRSVLVRGLRRIHRRAQRARRLEARAVLLDALRADDDEPLREATSAVVAETARRLERARRRLKSRLKPSRIEPLVELLAASATTLPASLPGRLEALEQAHRRGHRSRARAREALRLAFERGSARRLAVAQDAVARWCGFATCRFEAGLAAESEPGFAAEIAELLAAIQHRTRLRRALARRLRPAGPVADTLALLLHEVDAERAALLERLRGLETRWLESEEAPATPTVTLPPVPEPA